MAAIAPLPARFVSHQQFFRGYLIGYMLVLGFSLGSMALLMLGHLTGGNWWMIGRRVMEAAIGNIPLLTILFLPIWFGRHSLYIWLDPAYVAAHHSVAAKPGYLNEPSGRCARSSILPSGTCGPWRCAGLAQAGCRQLAASLAAAQGVVRTGDSGLWPHHHPGRTDWIMSLDPTWYSTIFGMFFMISEMLSMMALLIVILCSLREFAPYDRILGPGQLHDYGKLMLTFTMVWAYFSFSQWLIIWAGNLPEEITWYLDRIHGGWQTVALALVLLQFSLPFLLLLSRDLKRDARKLVPVALLVLVMRYVDLYWLVAPNPFPGSSAAAHHLTYHWTYFVAPLALVSIWLGMFFRQLGRRPLLVVTEPMLPRLWEPNHDH